MYLSTDIVTKAFQFLGGIERNPEGKSRQEKVSALSYLLATSELLKSHGQTELNLAPSESELREEFKNSVSEFKALLGTDQFSVDMYRKFDNDVAGSVSSNFLTTVVSQSKHLVDPKSYPSRSSNSALLSILKEKVSIHSEFKSNLNNYYNFLDIKTSLAIWLSKKYNFLNNQKITDQLNGFLFEKYTSPVFDVLKVSEQDIKDFGIDESTISNHLSVSTANLTNLIQNNTPLTSSENINDITENLFTSIKNSGLTIAKELITRTVVSAVTKRFVILTGLSGSGKTKLAEAMAYWLANEPDKQICLVAVGADWTNNEPLLGYADAITPGQYCTPASGILKLLGHATNTPTAPHFLILDEMNLSHVERYFADFLSAMESSNPSLALHGQDKLTAADGTVVPDRQALPPNLFIIGTVNVDETTYMFSPKVLDRANVIEFRVAPEQMEAFLAAPAASVSVKDLAGQGAHYGEAFVSRAKADASLDTADAALLQQDLLALFKPLSDVGAEFGYRSAKEIARFVAIHRELSGEGWQYKDALDAQVMQKLMPKLHGSARKLSGVLDTLKKFAEDHELPLTKNKVDRMQKRLKDEGFTSFAEN
jgi:energy-coupling factor transporter ATP-binding protein EcfA2